MEPDIITPPEIALMHVGINDVINKAHHCTDISIAENIVAVADKCKKNGVKGIIVSGLTKVSDFFANQRIERVNNFLHHMCNREGYMFCDNSKVSFEHLWKDGLHLNENGRIISANNFIDAISSY